MQSKDQLQTRIIRKQVSVGLLISGFLVWISFVTFLIPLGLYHVAQVAAALSFRKASTLLLTVVTLSGMMGVLLGSEICMSAAFVGTLWTPIFLACIHQRQTQKSMWLSAALLFLPVILIIGACFGIQQIPDFVQFLQLKKQTFLQQMAALPSSSTKVSSEQFNQAWEQTLQRLQTLPDFLGLSHFLALSSWQRLMWLVYEPRVSYFFIFGALMGSMASLVFLDHAFEQVERFRALLYYVLKNRARFPAQLVEGLEEYAKQSVRLKKSSASPVEVVSHKAISSEVDHWWHKLLQPSPIHQMSFWGYRFQLREAHIGGWNLAAFKLPLLLGLLAVFAFAGLFWVAGGSLDELTSLAMKGNVGHLSSCLAIIALMGTTILAVQGMLVTYQRLSSSVLFALIFFVLFVGWEALLSPYLTLGVFGVVGLLDTLYDFRGLKEVDLSLKKA